MRKKQCMNYYCDCPRERFISVCVLGIHSCLSFCFSYLTKRCLNRYQTTIFLDWFKSKAFADDKTDVAKINENCFEKGRKHSGKKRKFRNVFRRLPILEVF